MVPKKHLLLPFVSTAFLVVLLGLASAQVFWQTYGQLALTTTRSNANFLPNINPSLARVPNYADEISSEHLFGRPLTTKKIDQAATQDIPDSLLNVVIKGILSLGDTAKSMAILSLENAGDKIFKAGDELTSGYSIHQIVNDGVVIDHNGRFEMIRLPRATLSEISAPINVIAKVDDENIASFADLGGLRTEVLRNPLALEQHISFVPYTRNGRFEGYQVNPGSKPEFFVRLGLEADDIVSSIDGVKIAELAGRMDILSNLSVATNLRLGIIRNDQEQQLLVDFSQ